MPVIFSRTADIIFVIKSILFGTQLNKQLVYELSLFVY